MASIRRYKKAAEATMWRVQYRSPDGRSRTEQGFNEKAEAEAWAAVNTTSMTSDTWMDPAAGIITVDQLGAQWLAAQTHFKPSTCRVTDMTWRVHVQPVWGRRAVAPIRA